MQFFNFFCSERSWTRSRWSAGAFSRKSTLSRTPRFSSEAKVSKFSIFEKNLFHRLFILKKVERNFILKRALIVWKSEENATILMFLIFQSINIYWKSNSNYLPEKIFRKLVSEALEMETKEEDLVEETITVALSTEKTAVAADEE